MARQLAIAGGFVTVAYLLAAAAGCSTTSAGEGAADGSVTTPDAQSDGGQSDAAPEASTSSACAAAGGQCRPASTCWPQAPEACGPGTVCCFENICAIDAGALLVQASDYDMSCTSDADCIAIAVGNPCQEQCAFVCDGQIAAINRTAMPQYASDVARTIRPVCSCQASSGELGPGCCRGGGCSTECPVPRPTVDASADTGADAATPDAGADAATDRGPVDATAE